MYTLLCIYMSISVNTRAISNLMLLALDALEESLVSRLLVVVLVPK
jgi:hypothetical protein